MTQFHQPSVWFLLLLGLLPLVWWMYCAPRRQAKLRYSSTSLFGAIRPGWAVRGRIALPLIRVTAIALLVLAMARPQKGNEQTRVFSEGIAIQMVVDRSGSMQAMDFKINGQPVDRLKAVRKVVREFVMGGEGLRGREDDLIGLVSFARFADSQCPLTLDHGYLLETLNKVEPAVQNEDGTAIGDALALGVERLRSLESERRFQGARKIKSKIMILLTDGENNAGDVDPTKAAELASTYGIRIYTIGAGTEGMAPFPVIDPFTGRRVFRDMPVSIDETMLKKIAEVTSAKYFRATDTDSLHRIYGEIDKLEKTKTEEKRYLQYRELATDSIQLGQLRLPPLLLCAFVLLSIEVLLANTWLRKVP